MIKKMFNSDRQLNFLKEYKINVIKSDPLHYSINNSTFCTLNLHLQTEKFYFQRLKIRLLRKIGKNGGETKQRKNRICR